MFSKNKPGESPATGSKPGKSPVPGRSSIPAGVTPSTAPSSTSAAPTSAPITPAAKPKPSPSILSSDVEIKGNINSSGDIQVEGKVDGDIRAHLLTIGEGATVKGEVLADDVVVNGRVIGRLRGLKVRLTATARVEGDIIHKTIAIESGAHFEGSVQRQDDPLSAKPAKPAVATTPAKPE